MSFFLRIISGARSGEILSLTTSPVRVGRQLECELRFHPEQDLEVSGLHAELERREDGWWLRDLESRNGTWVNGSRLQGERRLHPGDEVAFGKGGPRVEFRDREADALLPTREAVASSPDALGPPGDAMATDASAPDRPGGLGPQRIRPALFLLVPLLALGAGALGFHAFRSGLTDSELARERDELARQVDSLLAAGDRLVDSIILERDPGVDELQGEMAGLTEALRESQAEVRRIRAELEEGGTGGGGRSGEASGGDEALRLQLMAATAALQRHQLAASLDFGAVEATNRRAVALVYAEAEDGRVTTGTAFAVRPDGTLVTSLHVLEGATGDSPALRIGVHFSDSEQVWPARILASSRESTLAVIKVDNIVGSVPTIQGLNASPDTLASGSPMALIGYPLGGDRSGVARPLVSAGVLSRNRPDFMEIEGYGAQGASGSPVLDRTGAVAAILFGGRPNEVPPLLLAVPSTEAIRLLESVPDPAG